MPTPVRRLGLFVLLTAAFALTCWQAPLYYSNQNQYFLPGLAAAGVGHLGNDWLAKTLDPTPLFSNLVAVTIKHLQPWVFHVYYALIQGIYAVALLGVFAALAGERKWGRWPAFLALLFVLHAAVVRWASYQWLGQDYAWYFQSGVAGQYVLGAMFQPSTFGVLLVAAIALFALDRPWAAVVCAALAATVHSTYLLHAGMLVLGFQAALLAERRWRTALGIGVLALALVLPVTWYVWRTFAPSSPTEFARAQQILVDFRIPHHARIAAWLDPVAWAQLVWVALGIALSGRRLAIALGGAALVALALSLAQLETQSPTLALLFPWRLSAVLVPIATAVILTRLVQVLPELVETVGVRTVCLTVVVLCIAGGLWVGHGRRGFHASDEELPLLAWARQHARPEDVYFIPFLVPDHSRSPRGSRSSDFRPLAEKKFGTQVIPIDLQRFRLHAGVPIFVDFKAIPYKDTEVLDWRERVRVADEVRSLIAQGQTVAPLATLRGHAVTHLVLRPAEDWWWPWGAEEVYRDDEYVVYRLKP